MTDIAAIPVSRWPSSIRRWWDARTLSAQFNVVSTCVLLIGMFVLGAWVTKKIEDGVAHASASSAALFLNSMVMPHLKELEVSGRLTDRDRHGLDEVATIAFKQRRIVSVKLWAPDGLVMYATDKMVEGKRFTPGEALDTAYRGTVAWEFDDLNDDENRSERVFNMPLIEIYAPVRDEKGRIFAVAEFYEDAVAISQDVREARWATWLVTAAVTLGMLAALHWIVARGSNVIISQEKALKSRVNELSDLLHQNEQLRASLQSAARRAGEDNERLLNQIGSDLHDGAAQLISLGLLHLGEEEDKKEVRSVLLEALGEVRAVSSGLMMPETRELTPSAAIAYICDLHERRTKTEVQRSVNFSTEALPEYVKTCLCRIVQEGLSNAFRHGGGVGQAVTIRQTADSTVCEVVDRGPGIQTGILDNADDRMGLMGLRQRVTNLGGNLELKPAIGGGTLLSAVLPNRWRHV